nr:reverse transcriptase domain-containing protein [Tanacetum cinerariifolium]
HSSVELHLHDIHVDQDKHEVDRQVRTAITNDSMGSSKPSKERFKEFANNSGVVVRRAFASTHFDKKSTSLVESDIQTNAKMADNRTMAQMLQAPIEGYEDAIVVPPINANNFELKQTLINLVQSNQFTGRQDSHNHLRFFNKVTSTFRHPEVPNTTVKLLLFPFSLEGEARIWLDKEPP